jgi:hypothetical protein
MAGCLLALVLSVACSRQYEPGLGSRLAREAALDGCPDGAPIPLPADCPPSDFPRICAVDCGGNVYGGGQVIPAGTRVAFSVQLDPVSGGVNETALTDPAALALHVYYDPCNTERSSPLAFVAEMLDAYQLAVHPTEPLEAGRAAVFIDVLGPIHLAPLPPEIQGRGVRFDFGEEFVGYCSDGGP